jgi:deazaflavin-dependent oxidoreductase (nitroreductase family)
MNKVISVVASLKRLALDYANRIWPLLAKATKAHVAIYRTTHGRIGHRLPWLPTILLLDHVGARTGSSRTTPLLYTRYDASYVVIASKGGYEHHPAWYYNLRAHPDTTVQVRAERIPVRARLADDHERDRLWKDALEVYPTYRDYQNRTDRDMPIIVLDPRPR